LPSSDTIFCAKLRTEGLLPGDLYNQVCKMNEAKIKTNAEINVFFLQNSIERYLEIDHTSNFTKLLKVMEEDDNRTLNILANCIEEYIDGRLTLPPDDPNRKKTGKLVYN